MHSGAQQTNLWEQSDLLDLAAAAPRSGGAEREPGQFNAETNGAPARVLAQEAADGEAPGLDDAGGRVSGGQLPAAAIPSAAGTAEPSPAENAEAFAALRPSRDAGEERNTTALTTAPKDTQEHGDTSPATPVAAPQPSLPRVAEAPNPAATQIQAGPEATFSLPACPERLLILDTETTALSPQQGQCIELGAVLFDVASRSVLMQVSFLLPCDHNPAQAVNGIPAAVSRLSQPWRSGMACFEAMLAGADAVLAHNAAFDRQWFGTADLPALDKPWICSMEDIRWPAERQLRATPSVRDLALAYGVPVWAAHRALTDCIYLVQVFQRCDELETLLQVALEPRRLVRARLSYDERQLAKDAGFRWNEPVPKAWSRRLSEREIAALPFPVDPVEPDEPGPDRRGRQELPWRHCA
jgi:DNA polymerase-3 subunit epsilon